MKFAQIIGQEALKGHFATVLKSKRFAQAYIIEGEPLSGKKTIANAFAAALLCERGGQDACGVCHSCKMAAAGSHPDIKHLTHELPNQYRVDEIKEQLVNDAWLRPFYGGYKVYIADEAEKITPQSQNALLKTLEDPPDFAVIMLLSSSAEAFLPTVRSRCIKLHMEPVPDRLIAKHLIRDLSMPEYEAKAVLAFARGNLGKAVVLAQNAEFSDMKRSVLATLSHLDERPLPQLFKEMEEIEGAYKDRMDDLFDLFVLWYRDVLVFKATGDKKALIFSQEDEGYALMQAARRMSYPRLVNGVKKIGDARRLLREHVKPVYVLQQLVLELRE